MGLLSSGVLLVAGIGLLRLENWGRKLSIGYAIYRIVFNIIGLVARGQEAWKAVEELILKRALGGKPKDKI